MMWNAFAISPAELREVRSAPDPFEAIRRLPPGRSSGLDKAWDAAHWLITGGTETVVGADGFIKSGGQELDDIDAGYGPAHYLEPKSVAAVRQVMNSLTREKLATRWDGQALHDDEVYPFAHKRADVGDAEFVLGHLDEFRLFLGQLSEHDGLLVFIN